MMIIPATEHFPSRPWFALRGIGDLRTRVIPCLDQLDIESYFPVVREMRRLPMRRLSHAQRVSGLPIMRPSLVPFWSGVTFIQFPIGFSRFDELFDLPSVLGLLMAGEQPVAVPDNVIAELRKREINGVIAGRTPARLLFQQGERVRIAHGAFTNEQGIIERIPDVSIQDIDPDTRLRLTIDIFGRPTPVDLSAWQIEKL